MGVKFERARRGFVFHGRGGGVVCRGVTRLIQKRICGGKAAPSVRSKEAAYGRRSGAAIDRVITRHIKRGTWRGLKGGEAKAFFDALASWDLEPVAAQVAVHDARRRVATAVDVVARCLRTNDTVVIEVKCGYQGCFKRDQGPCPRRALRALRVTALLRAELQACFGARMYTRNCGAAVQRVLVVQITRRAVVKFPVRRSTLACAEAAWKIATAL
jgi:hypothetical protein